MSCGSEESSEESSNDAPMDTEPSSVTVTENPVTENPVIEDPVTEDPVIEDPVTEDPVIEDPVTEDPVIEDPVTEDPVIEDPVTEDPVIEDPVTEDPVIEDPVTEDPVIEDPVTQDPVIEDPVTEDPNTSSFDEIFPTGGQEPSNFVNRNPNGFCVDANDDSSTALLSDDGVAGLFWSNSVSLTSNPFTLFPFNVFPPSRQRDITSCYYFEFPETAADQICVEAWATKDSGCSGCFDPADSNAACGHCPSSCSTADGNDCSNAVCHTCNGSKGKIRFFSSAGDINTLDSNSSYEGEVSIDATEDGTEVCFDRNVSATSNLSQNIRSIAVCRGACTGNQYNIYLDWASLRVEQPSP